LSFLSRFSRDTQEIAKFARQIAEDNRQSYISSTHFFMAILAHRENFACQIIENIGYEPMGLYEDFKKMLSPEVGDGIIDELIFTPEVKSVFELAEKEMEKTKWDYIDSIHILLALLKSSKSEFRDIIKGSGINYKEVMSAYEEAIEHTKSGIHRAANEIFNAVSDGISQRRDTSRQNSTQRSKKRKGNTPALETFGRNLTSLAREDKLDPVIGRDKEIERIWRILARRKKNNVIITGESGTGKTAIAEGLANYIAQGKAPSKLSNKEIYLLDVSGMVAGSKYRGDFEKKMKAVIDECIEQKNIVLFIDEIHTIIGAGGAEGSMDGANILKPALANGDLQVIGATTSEEYQKYFEKDGAMVRRFQKVGVNPPNKEDTIKILQGLRKHYEDFHSVTYSDDIVELIVELSDRYVSGQYEPDRSINTLDEVGSKLSLVEKEMCDEFKELNKKYIRVQKKMDDAADNQEYDLASELKKEAKELDYEMGKYIDAFQKDSPSPVTEDDVREVFSLISGVPVESINSSSNDAKRYLTMGDDLNKKVINQEEAIGVISKAIKRKKAGVDDTSKPTVLMFAGPTGCGKTFTSKKMAEFLFGDEKKLIFLNGAEYADQTAANRLSGANPGYVGYGEATDFETVRNNPYSILLVDECEKMHKDVWHTFLRIFEEGELKTSNGKTINFKNTVIILTSNLGSEISKKKSMGFDLGEANDEEKERKQKYEKAIKDYFKPEVFNRISKIVVFNDLNREDLRNIVKLELKSIISTLKEKGIKLTVNQKACDYLINNSDDSTGNLGARPIKRSIESHLNDDIADILLERGDDIKSINVTVSKEELKINAK
jgi:ATP-dependent Clp protease ATP-binding subunit ClpC